MSEELSPLTNTIREVLTKHRDVIQAVKQNK
jgi:hypothetical protein